MGILPLFLFLFGLVILIKGASLLIRGSSSLAIALKISPAIIGFTIVAFGTSLPEFIISITSSISGNTNIILGNILGSNIANTFLILGASAFIYPLKIQKNIVLKVLPLLFLTTLVFSFLAINIQKNAGEISMMDGLLLLVIFAIFILYLVASSALDTAFNPPRSRSSMLANISLISLGLIGLTVGSKLLVDNGVLLAKMFGVSETFIGLTLIAIGTSIPELTTSVMAAIKREPGIAVGNIIGSNVFNLFFILGLAAIIKPIAIPSVNYTDIIILLISIIVLFICMFNIRRYILSRLEGLILLLLFIAYLAFIIWRG